jgi:hypothetical protein
MNNRSFKTARGTELPVLNLRGKEYLEVKYRLVWFREEHPDWSIQTEFVSITDKSALAKASILDVQGRVVSTSHKFENERGFPDFLEKAETGAIGRALALVGYGTQFCADELDEGARIVDSPVSWGDGPAQDPGAIPGGLTRAAPSQGGAEAEPGEYLISFGRKYKGKKVREVPRAELEGYLAWLEAESAKKGAPLGLEVRLLKKAAELYFASGAAEAS